MSAANRWERKRKTLNLTLSLEAHRNLGALAELWGCSKSRVVERLAAEAIEAFDLGLGNVATDCKSAIE